MRMRGRLAPLIVALCVAACATPPPIEPDEYEDHAIVSRAPMTEYPPIEPVEPPPEPAVIVQPLPVEPSPVPETAPEPVAPPGPAPAAPVEISADEQQMNALLADLQRYASLPGEDARRELNAVTQALVRQRTDANRVRLAMLYTIARAGPQDDQRAVQLLDNVAKSGPGSPAVKQLALVLHAQITERLRAVREEQQKADAAIQKLEALRALDRTLLRDRTRGGGGEGGGGGGGGGGGSAGGR
jgi:acyl transferase domain-containing protein